MDNTSESFVEQVLVPGLKKQGHDIHDKPVTVGDEFELSGRTFRVRKITGKDIICRPASWNQDNVRNKDEF